MKKQQPYYIDDIDGSEGAIPCRMSIVGVELRVDLTPEHASELEAQLAALTPILEKAIVMGLNGASLRYRMDQQRRDALLTPVPGVMAGLTPEIGPGARSVSSTAAQRAGTAKTASKRRRLTPDQSRRVREWAVSRNRKVNWRGSVPAQLIADYEAECGFLS